MKHLAEKAGAYWLLEYIFSSQFDEILRSEEFQVWKIEIREDDSAIITVEDGNDNSLKKFTINYTDFPFDNFDLWLIGNRLILPSEY